MEKNGKMIGCGNDREQREREKERGEEGREKS